MRATLAILALSCAASSASALTCAEAEIAVCDRHFGFMGECPDALRASDGAWGMVANIYMAEATLFALDAGTPQSRAIVLEADSYLACFEPNPDHAGDLRAADRLAQDVTPELRARIRTTMEAQQ